MIATDSPIVMAYPKARIFLLTDNEIRPVAYEETDHFQVTRRFLSNPDGMLKVLLDGD